MATTIQNLRSLTAGNQPGDLAPGELAFNLADGFMYLGSGGNNYVDTLGQVIGPSLNPGGGWQQAIFNAAPINGGVTLAGIYDAQDNLVTSVTPAGTAAGFTAGAALPAAAAGNEGYYVLVQIGGTMTPPAPTGDAQPGDWIVSSGAGWALVAESSVVIPASQVTIIPTGDFTGPSMQDVLNQIQLLYVSQADGTMSQLNCNGDALVYGNTTLGDDAASDTLTVNAVSTFNGQINATGLFASTAGVSATTGFFAGNLRTTNNLIVDTNTTLGADATSTTTINGSANLANNLTVAGVTQLNGATQINDPLTTTDSVSFTGTAGITLGTNLVTTGNIGITLGGSSNLQVNSTQVTFTSGATVGINGNLALNQGATISKIVTYARPGNYAPSQVNENLNNFLVIPGTIIAYGGTSVPEGYLLCDGSSYNGTSGQKYFDLWQAIGTTWGGSGQSSFKVPDLRGMFVRGAGTNANGSYKTASGQTPVGPAVAAVQKDQFGNHNHTLTLNTTDYAAGFKDTKAVLALNTDQQQTGQKSSAGNMTPIPQGGGEAVSTTAVPSGQINETRPLAAGVSYLIKY